MSNWNPDSELGGLIDAKSYALRRDFFDSNPRSNAGKARSDWATELGATPVDVVAFCQCLRFRLGLSISDLEERLDREMAHYGLQTGQNARSIALGLVRGWVMAGGDHKRVTAESLRAAIKGADLQQRAADAPPLVLWIHGWAKQTYEGSPSIELDWSRFFHRDSRRVPTQADWDNILRPELVECRERFAAMPVKHFIDFRGKLPLTNVLAIGSVFPEVAGYSFRVEQPTNGAKHLWRSDSPPTARRFDQIEESGDGESRHLLVVLSITGDAAPEARVLVRKISGGVKAAIFAVPDGGANDGAIGSAGDAKALAIAAKGMIREARQRLGTTETHLVLFAPAASCLFLGQLLNALGDVVTYERAEAGGYLTSQISTAPFDRSFCQLANSFARSDFVPLTTLHSEANE